MGAALSSETLSGSDRIVPLAGKGETFSLMESESLWPGRCALDPTMWKFRCDSFMSHQRAKAGCLPAAPVEAKAGEIVAGQMTKIKARGEAGAMADVALGTWYRILPSP